eukprot:6812475-Pyramimonas_sp.AAC.1
MIILRSVAGRAEVRIEHPDGRPQVEAQALRCALSNRLGNLGVRKHLPGLGVPRAAHGVRDLLHQVTTQVRDWKVNGQASVSMSHAALRATHSGRDEDKEV